MSSHYHTLSRSESLKKQWRDGKRKSSFGNWKGGISKKPDYSAKNLKRWREKNPDKAVLQTQRRRAFKVNADGYFTLGEWELLKKQYGYTCPSCGKKEPEIKLTVDHIIPLSRGGSDYVENIQPLCGSCNSKKGSKFKEKLN